MFNDFLTIGTLMFVVFSFLNVILQTIKTILTVKASKGVAALINAVTFGFYTIVVKQLVGVEMVTAVCITIITNLIGVWVACWILEKTKKDKLWVFNVLPCLEIEKMANLLDEKNIEYNFDINFRNNVMEMSLKIFSYTQANTILIMDLMKEYNTKYYITEAIQVGGK